MAYNYTNLYVMLFELTGIIIMLFISAHLSKNMKRSTGLTVGILLLLIAVHHLELWSQTIPDRYVLRFILTACKYSLYPVVMIVLMTIFSPFVSKANRKWFALLWIPEVVSVPIYFTSQWTGLVASFRIGEDHMSHYVGGGVLHFWPFMIFGLYLGLFVIANIIYLRRYSVRNRIISIFIFVGSVLGVILNLFFGDGDDYTPFFVSALLLYYLFMYIHMASTDSLTGLMNRQSYYQDLRMHGGRINAVVSVDMNNLKYLNDNFGHDAGDTALKTVAETLRANMGEHAAAYRVGGDEFIILYAGVTEESVQNNIENMRAKMDETDYVCAFGYAMTDNKTDVYKALISADEKMYADKNRLKNESKE